MARELYAIDTYYNIGGVFFGHPVIGHAIVRRPRLIKRMYGLPSRLT